MKKNLAFFEKGHDKEKRKLVIKRMANEDRLAALPVDDGVKFFRTNGRSHHLGRCGKKSFTQWKNWGCWLKTRRVPGSKALQKVRKGNQESLSWRKNWRTSTGKPDEHTRAIMRWGLTQLRKIREEEEAAKELLEEVQDRKQQLEDELWKEMEDHEQRMSGTLKAKVCTWYRAVIRNQRIWSTTLLRLWPKSQNWVGKTVKRLSRCWLEKEEDESS